MTETDEILAITAGDYKIHVKAIAQLQVALTDCNQQIAKLKKENEALKESIARPALKQGKEGTK